MSPVVGLVLKRSVLVVAVLMALVFTGAASPSAPSSPADEATAYQLDATHDGSMADAGLTAPLAQAWSIDLPDATSYPLIADGMVFVTAANRRVYALNQATGNTIWSHALGGTYKWSGLAYDSGQVFVMNNSGLLTAFDAATGSIAWSDQLPGQSFSESAPTATNGVVYVGGTYAVRESDGHLLWMQSVGGNESSPAVTSQGVYMSYACQHVYDLDPLTGNQLWHDSGGCSGGGARTPVVASGHVFARDVDLGNLILSPSTGAKQGTFSADAAPAVANGVAYMLSGSTLSAVGGAGLGTTNWTFPGVDTAPIVVGGLVFVGSSGGNLYALDAATGATSWSTNVGASIPAPDEVDVSQPLTGLGAANGTLVVSAGSKLVAYQSAGAITDAPSNQSPPTVEGSAALNENEAADVGIWSGLPSGYAYQWELCDGAGANCADIAGATDPTYVPSADDYEATLRVRVVATNGIGSSAPVESAASAVLGLSTAAPLFSTAPVVSGTPTVGQQLSTTSGTWANSATSYAYQWQRCDENGSNCVDIAGATSSQYTLVEDDAGSEIRSEVLASNAIGPASGNAPSAATAVIVELGTPTIPTSPADEATGYQLDAAHDGYMTDAGLAAPLTQAWSDNLPGDVWYSLIVNGTVFITTGDKMVYALNQATGSTIWSHPIGGVYTWSGLTYDRGRVFVLDSDGVLSAFDATSGAIAWSEQLPGQYLFLSPPTAMNGIVYADGGGVGGTVYAVQESDGQVLWTQSVDIGGNSSPAVNAQGVYVSSGCQETYDLDPVLGSPLWHFTSGCTGGGGATPIVASGHVFVTGSPLGSVILSSSTGATQGAFNPGPAPAVANGVAFMLDGSTLAAVGGAGLGNENWTFTGDGHLDTAPIVVGGLVFVGSSAGMLYALDATTGATSWSTSVGAPITGDEQSFAAANGTLLVSAGSELVAYRHDGAITDVPSNQSPPTVDGPPDLSGIEAADVGIWSGLPGAYAYQWELCDAAGANCADIAGATGASYLPPAEDVGVGATLRVRVVATNGVGSSDPVESAPSATSPLLLVSHQQSLRRQGRVVSNAAAVGQQLSTTNGIWTDDPTSYAYKWQRCNYAGLHCVDIAGATGSQYTIVSADTGDEVRSEVRASNVVGPASTYAPSPPTSPVGGLPKPKILERAGRQRDGSSRFAAFDDPRGMDEHADGLLVPVAALQQHRLELREHRERDRFQVHARRRRCRP